MKAASWGWATVLAVVVGVGGAVMAADSPITAREGSFVFLNTGTNKTPLQKDEAQKMQAAHIGNLERLGKAGKATMAGPLGDRGPIRGVVVMTMTGREDSIAEFSEDPFVKNQYLAVEWYRWRIVMGQAGKPDEPFKGVMRVIALVKKGPSWAQEDSKKSLAEWFPLLGKLDATGEVPLAGTIRDGGDLLAVAFLLPTELAEAQKLVDSDRSVQAGKIRVELHPQFVAAGVLERRAAAVK